MTSHAAGAAASARAKGSAAVGTSAAAWPRPGVAYYAVFLLILSLTSLQIDTNIVPYVAGKIKADLKLSDANLSLLLGAAFALFYTIVGIPISGLVDRYSRKWIIAIGIAVWSLGTALCGVAQNTLQLFLARFVVGAGEAGNGPASYSLLADLFPRERMPRAVAVMQLGSVIGPALALAASAYLLHAFLDMTPVAEPWGLLHGWQLILILVGLPGLLVAVLLIATMPTVVRRSIPGQVGSASNARAGGIRDYLDAFAYMGRHWGVFAPMFGGLFIGSLGVGAQQWMPIFYQRTYGWHPSQVAALSSISNPVVMIVSMIIGVMLAERFERQGKTDSAVRVLVISRVLTLPGIFGVLMPSPWLAFAFSQLAFVGIGLGAPSQNAAMQIVCPAEMRGKVTALYLFFYSVIGIALSPFIVGALSDYFFHNEAMIRWSIFLPAIIFQPVSLLVIWLGMKPYGREVERLKALEAGA